MVRASLSLAGLGLAAFLDGRWLHMFGLPLPVVVVMAILLVAPVVAVFRAPLTVWRFTAAGLFACELAVAVWVGPGYNDTAWPWPVFGMGVLGVALFVVASRHDRVTIVVTGGVTVVTVFVPALVIAGTSLVTVGALTCLTGVLLAWGGQRADPAGRAACARGRDPTRGGARGTRPHRP